MTQSNQYSADELAGCGPRLRRAREEAGFTHRDISARLKVPEHVVRALESSDWASLGAPVFARGQLRSYARLLRLDIETDLAATPVATVAPPLLVSHTHTPRLRRVAEQVARRAIYVAVTAAIAVPIWMATSPHLANPTLPLQSLDLPTATAPAVNAAPGAKTVAAARTPLVASFTSLGNSAATAAPGLQLTFKRDSWVQVFATDGRALEQGLLEAGQSRGYAAGEVGRVVLGNASAVSVSQAGRAVELTPFSRANVARFTLSSDGSLTPVSQ